MTVVFDLGNVLVDWNPERLYARLLPDPRQRSTFLTEVCSPQWHDRQDRGRSTADATAELVAKHPESAELIQAFYGRWSEMFGGALPATVDVVAELARRGVRLLALTNWPREQFADARVRFPFLAWFEGIVVSGEEGVAKPDEAIFRVLLERYELDPAATVYVDDNPGHVATARRLGLTGLSFTTPVRLRRDLASLGLPVSADVDIRPGTAEDLPALTDIYNHYVVDTVATFDVVPFAVAQRRNWLRHYDAAGRHRLLVATVAGAVAGYATSSAFRAKPAYDPSIELTVYLDPQSAGRGIGSMLYQELFRRLAGEDVHAAFAAIALPNDASVALHRRFGFVDVGVLREVGRKFDNWWDVLWMQRPLP